MAKILCALVAAMFAILVSIGTWWISGVNEDRAIVRQLQWKDQYLNGNIAAAPVKPALKP